MRVLMFGWEFPPHISGGLGTACFGLTTGLIHHNVEVLFVVPKLFGDEEKTGIRFINASDTGIDLSDPYYHNLLKQIKYIQISSDLLPYLSPEQYSSQALQIQRHTLNEDTRSGMTFHFSGHYGKDLMQEVSRYTLVAAHVAKKNQFEIIHAHDWLTYPAGIMAKQESGKPLIIHVHATEFDRSGNNVNQTIYDIEKNGMQEADHIIAVSDYTKQILIKNYGIQDTKIKVVYNGVIPLSPEIEKQVIPKKKKIVTFLGRVTFQKGPDYFVEAARKVLTRFPETHFVMAGNGDMLLRMIKRVAELRMSSRFHFTGFLKGGDTNKMYALSDVYVMPSVSEPFGISPLEAVRSGVPVIISKQSGVSEVLQNALKVDFWDTDALSDSICALLKHNSLSRTFTSGGLKELKKLKWEHSAYSTKQIYRSLLNTTL